MARQQFMVQTEDIITKHAAADDAALGAWLRLCAHCAPRLLAGRIPGAARWSEAAAMRTAGVSRSALDQVVADGLARWEGDDLVLESYDHEGEAVWKRKSVGGSSGRLKQTSGSGTGTPAGTPSRSAVGTPRRVPTPLPQAQSQPVPPGEATGLPTGIPQGVSDCESVSESQSGGSPSPVNPAREEPLLAAAAALPADRWTPETAQQLATLLGGRDHLAGQPLAGEWRNAFAGQTAQQVQATWLAAGEPIKLPSSYLDHRKDIEMAEQEQRLLAQTRQEAAERRRRVELDQAEQAAARERRIAASRGDWAKAVRLLAALDADSPRWVDALDHGTKLRVDRLRTLVAEQKAVQPILAQVLTSVPAELREAVAAAAEVVP